MNISDRLHHLLESTSSHVAVRIERNLIAENKVNKKRATRRTRVGLDRAGNICLVCKEHFAKTANPGFKNDVKMILKQIVLELGQSVSNVKQDFCDECVKAANHIAELKRQSQLIENKINAILTFLRRAIKTGFES